MTEQATVNDIASMLMPANEPEQSNDEPTGGTDEQEAGAVNTEEAEAQTDEDLSNSDGDYEDDEDEIDDQEPERRVAKIGGEEFEVTFDEAVAGYQRDSDYRKGTMANADARKAIDARGVEIDTKLQELDAFIKREDDSTDWESLMTDDPGEYLKRKKELDTVKEAKNKAQAERDGELKTQREAMVATETAKIIDVMGGDTWTTEQRNTDMSAATDYLKGVGFTENDISGFIDHRVWQLAFDASKAKRFAKASKNTKEEVRKAPKSVKPDQKIPPSERKRAAARNKLAKSNKHNQIDALANLLKLE